MFRRFSVNFALFSMGMDALIVVASLAIATFIRPILSDLPFAATVAQYQPMPISIYLIFALSWVLIFMLLSVYDGRKNVFVVDEVISLTLGSILAGVALAGALFFSYREVSRLLFLFFVVQCYVLMLTWRMIYRIAFRRLNGDTTQYRRVIVIGAGPVGRELQTKLLQHPYLGLKLVGFLDDDTNKMVSESDIIGAIHDARKVITNLGVQDVVIALPGRAYAKVNQLSADLHDLAVKVWVVPDYFHLALHKATIEEFAGIPMLDLRAPALNDYQRMVKRGFDLLLTFFLLPVALVFMGIIAIAIRLEGKGPILFRQKRVGENGQLFDMYKFRTMVPEAEELRQLVENLDDQGNIIYKIREDPRVTRLGRFIRRTSLDELPQIFNIIKGEMSLVGPRPEMPYLVDLYEPWQRKRFAVPQGITGWWQVNGRSDKPMHLHTEDDLYYVQNYSLLLDIQILLKTVLVVLRGKGAF